MGLSNGLERLVTVHFGHHQVEKHEVYSSVFDQTKSGRSPRRDDGYMPRIVEAAGQHLSFGPLVIDNEDPPGKIARPPLDSGINVTRGARGGRVGRLILKEDALD